MKTTITISGILGVVLLLFRLIGIMTEFPINNILSILAFISIGLVFIPCLIIDKLRQNRKIDRTIASYTQTSNKDKKIAQGSKVTKGWGMNNSPFRDRKAGVTWGGGNIKGANVSRGKRKSFLN